MQGSRTGGQAGLWVFTGSLDGGSEERGGDMELEHVWNDRIAERHEHNTGTSDSDIVCVCVCVCVFVLSPYNRVHKYPPNKPECSR